MQITPAATNAELTQQGFPTVFRTVAAEEYIGQSLGRYSVGVLGANSIAVIDDRTAYGQGVPEAFTKVAKASGAVIVSVQFT
ncbi:hypothetical protein ACH46F_02925 [Streptomyces virginiae]|uniref:hypothetical protein n=1 Tax=Streptomyces virginiae TaxID=1961 RepID=UPI0037B2C320